MIEQIKVFGVNQCYIYNSIESFVLDEDTQMMRFIAIEWPGKEHRVYNAHASRALIQESLNEYEKEKFINNR